MPHKGNCSSVHTYNTRQKKHVCTPQCRLINTYYLLGLVGFLKKIKLSEKQNGFGISISTITAIYQALQTILDNLNNDQVTMTLCLDLSSLISN